MKKLWRFIICILLVVLCGYGDVECIARGGELSVELDSVVVGVLMLKLSELFVLV